MLYYLTGMATERSAVLAYNLLHDGVVEIGENAVAQTVIAPIRRQEPGHYAFYQLSARGLWAELAAWQQWMVRRLRSVSFAPVGANNDDAEGRLRRHAGHPRHRPATPTSFAGQISRVERELLWARKRGLKVPPYVARRSARPSSWPRRGRAGP